MEYYGVSDITGVPKEELVKCNGCNIHYYDEPGDPRDTNCLQTMEDVEGTVEMKARGINDKAFFRGCPLCKTDAYLMDLV